MVGVPVLLVILFGVAVSDSAAGLVLAVLLGLFVVLLALCAALAIHVRWFQLAAPVVVVERRGVFEALVAAAGWAGASSGGSSASSSSPSSRP